MVTRFAGVLVLCGNDVLMVRAGDQWSKPGGHVEDGETPRAAAVRELAEEAGVILPPDELEVVSESVVVGESGEIARAWNFVAQATDRRVLPNDPDGDVDDARWFSRTDAVAELALLPYPPLREPAISFLRDGVRGRQWVFEIVDGPGRDHGFTWSEPPARSCH